MRSPVQEDVRDYGSEVVKSQDEEDVLLRHEMDCPLFRFLTLTGGGSLEILLALIPFADLDCAFALYQYALNYRHVEADLILDIRRFVSFVN